MTNAAAAVLAMSLIIAGVSILGDVLGWWRLQGDLWGVVLVLLGTAARWTSGRINGNGAPPPTGEPPIEADPVRSNGDKTPPAALGLILLLLFPAAEGCGSAQLRADAEAWARCAGGGALVCIPSSGFEDPARAGIAYAGCVAQRSIACAAPLVSRANPPDLGPDEVDRVVDRGCVAEVSARCLPVAAADNLLLSRYASPRCVRDRIPRCWRR